jgi:tetratricopeptide (TPR) repeat protein
MTQKAQVIDDIQSGSGTAGAAARPETPVTATKPTAIAELEKDQPLSRSLIWARQRDFYVRRGLDAWTADRVPQFITNNPFIAEIYADVVAQFVRDCIEHPLPGSKPPSKENPVRVLELGAGVGKFAYLFLRHVALLLREHGIAPDAVRYVMTDCSPGIVESWRGNSYLAEFVQSGLLELALFDAGQEGRPWDEQSDFPAGPLVVIANYVFDSLPQDAFRFVGGQMNEFLITTAASDQAQENPEPEPLSKLRLSFQDVPISRDRYADAIWNGILEGYRKQLSHATVLFPTATLSALEKLRAFSDGRMLVLAADKGHAYEDTLALVQGPPAFEWHAADCFSLMTNFDAIGKAFRAAASGGQALLPDKHSSNLHICGFLRGRAGDAFPRTAAAYREAQAAFGPDDLFALLAWLNAHMEEIGVPQILATLRLSRWDPIALLRLFPVLGRQLGMAHAERHDLREAVLRIWANHYPVSPEENVLAFDCGVILLELRFFEEAMRMFRTSRQVLGPSAATSYNLGLCAIGLGQDVDALGFMSEACALDPGLEPAQRARARLESESVKNG